MSRPETKIIFVKRWNFKPANFCGRRDDRFESLTIARTDQAHKFYEYNNMQVMQLNKRLQFSKTENEKPMPHNYIGRFILVRQLIFFKKMLRQSKSAFRHCFMSF